MTSVETGTSAEVPQDFSIENFADIVASMSRFLTRFASTEPFKEAHLGLAEWLGLMTLKSKPGLSNKQFAKLLGTTVQRAAQITDALKKADLITVSQTADDARVHSMNVTPAGMQRLVELNGKLSPMICSGLGSRVNSLGGTKKNLARLLRMVSPAMTGK